MDADDPLGLGMKRQSSRNLTAPPRPTKDLTMAVVSERFSGQNCTGVGKHTLVVQMRPRYVSDEASTSA